jgi:hypothetical protein
MPNQIQGLTATPLLGFLIYRNRGFIRGRRLPSEIIREFSKRGGWFAFFYLCFVPLVSFAGPGEKKIQAMAPLFVADPRWTWWQSDPRWHTFYLEVLEGVKRGVSGVSIDVWQGAVQPNGRGADSHWEYYDQAFRIMKDAGAKRSAVLSWHKAGVNVGDSVMIGIAPHIRDKISGMVKLRQIRLNIPPHATADEKAKLRTRMQSIASRARTESFEALARENSDDEYANDGGDIGWTKRGSMEKARDEALNLLRPGQVSRVIETPYAFYLLQVAEMDSKHPDLAYVSETGARNDALVSIWGINYVIEDLKAHWREFRDRYGHEASEFTELIVGAGSAGEWRLPAYDSHDRDHGFGAEADYPGRGLLQISSWLAQQSLRSAMQAKYTTIESLNQAWELKGADAIASWDDFHALTTKAEVDAFLASKRQYSQMGQDIFGWQHNALLAYGKILLEAMIEVFHEPGSPFATVPIAIKIPGVHWHFQDRFPQLACGLISTVGAKNNQPPEDWVEEKGQGYRGFFEEVFNPLRGKYPNSAGLLYPIFTCAEMRDCHFDCLVHCPGANCHCAGKEAGTPYAVYGRSRPESLLNGFANLAAIHRQPYGIENALNGGLYSMEGNRRIEAALNNPWARFITYLRLSDVVSSNNPYTLPSIQRIRQGKWRTEQHAQPRDCAAELAGNGTGS